MATVEDDDAPADAARPSETATLRGFDRVTLAVAGVTLLALVLRFVALGERIAHWDEARVGWWIPEFMQTGEFAYQPIIHGPFYQIVNRPVFAALGATDFTMRLVVALIGALAPLTALGLRHRLRDVETVVFALFLAANPLILYYTRFMRGDPLVAIFMLAAFVLFVRLWDFGEKRYLFGGVAFVALALTAKENAILYPVTWLGALVLVADKRLLLAIERDEDWTSVLGAWLFRTLRALWAWLPWLALSAVEFLAIVVFFYAPRANDPGELGLYNALGDPSMLWPVIQEATMGSVDKFLETWIHGGHQEHAYLPFLGHFLKSMGYGAIVLVVFAVAGFLVARYARSSDRPLVEFAFFWGLLSVLGYPIVTDIQAGWTPIHAVVPLAIPAAVGVAIVVGWARAAYRREDLLELGMTVALLFVVAGLVASMGLWTVYLAPQSDANHIVQYAQPGDDLRPALVAMQRASRDHEGIDVLLYGKFFVDDQDPNGGNPFVDGELRRGFIRSPACANWFNALPLPWYFRTADADVSCSPGVGDLQQRARSGSPPPVVIASNESAPDVRRAFPDYWSATYELRTYGTETVFFVSPEYANGTAG
ncbi:MAG: flippase activity-associated protein Agl23 [Haloarculaceae archaeon]